MSLHPDEWSTPAPSANPEFIHTFVCSIDSGVVGVVGVVVVKRNMPSLSLIAFDSEHYEARKDITSTL